METPVELAEAELAEAVPRLPRGLPNRSWLVRFSSFVCCDTLVAVLDVVRVMRGGRECAAKDSRKEGGHVRGAFQAGHHNHSPAFPRNFFAKLLFVLVLCPSAF